MAISQYTTGYSIGVGGVVLHKGKVLFVRGKSKPSQQGLWQLPGGFVERSEAFDAAVLREVYEEARIKMQDHRRHRDEASTVCRLGLEHG